MGDQLPASDKGYDLVTCLVGDKYTEEMNDALNPDWTYRGEYMRLPGVWNKLLMLLRPGPCVYIDLDSVVRGRIPFDRRKKLAVGRAYWKDKVPVNEFNRDTRFNSSVMSWVDPQREIVGRFLENADYYMRKYAGIDRFLWWECSDLVETFDDGIFESNSFPRYPDAPVLTYNGEDFGPYFNSN